MGRCRSRKNAWTRIDMRKKVSRYYCEYDSPTYREVVKEMSDKNNKSGALKELEALGFTSKNLGSKKRGRFSSSKK